MARCKGCIHENVCNREVGYGYSVCPHYINTADVVPKSEVAREIFAEIETCMKNFEDDDDGYLLKKCEFEFFMRELKKKYTENL